MKRTIAIILIIATALCLSLASLVGCTPQPDGPDEGAQVVIFHTNDTHGYLQESEKDGLMGFARVAALKKQTKGALLIDAGDALQGLPLASLSKGADVVELFNIAGYDAMGLGNHEFDFGTENLLANAKKAQFPMLSANVYKDGKPILSDVSDGNGCNVMLESNGIRIGVFALTTADTATSTNPQLISDLEFRNEIDTAKAQIDELEEAGADAIIAVCHMGDEMGGATHTSDELAEAMTGEYADKLTAIIDGHSHTVEDKKVNGVLIAQTGTGMGGLGKMTLTYENGKVNAEEELLAYADVSDVTPEKAVEEKLASIVEAQSALLDEEVGEINFTLWGGSVGVIAVNRVVETNYGDFAADAIRSSAKGFADKVGETAPVIAVENGGGIRAAIPYGKVTTGDFVSAFPFSNTVYIKKITPKILYEVMEVSGSKLDGQNAENGMLLQKENSGGFLQISGFRVRFNPSAEGNRVVSIMLDGSDEPLDRADDKTAILMASNNYVMSGGSGYKMLSALPKLGETGGEMEIVRGYFEECVNSGAINGYARPQGRILMDGGAYTPKDYEATLLVEKDGKPLTNETITYILDGGSEAKTAQTDENGYIRIVVSDGTHSVRLDSVGSREAYIDNYAGIGLIEDEFRKFPVLR